ncbi:MAG TPA: hypothetical protein VHW09_25535 [Bryobacteraceae bacterium]|nr:hypothetical protein [Bryobacteraceae bacterium]
MASPDSGSGRPWGTKSRGLVTLVQVGSLLATALMVWVGAFVPRLHRQTLSGLLWQVIGYTLLAWIWSAAVAFLLYAIVPREDRSDMVADVLRTAATAVWFGPAMILLSNFSLLSLAPALVLVVYASRLLYSQWLPALPAAPVRVTTAREPGRFADCQLPQVFVWRERLPALGVAFCLEAGAIAVAAHFPLLGAAWFCVGTAVLTVSSMATGAAGAGRPPTLPKSIVGILATIVLASLLTLGQGGSGGFGLGDERASGGPHPGLLETARMVLRQLFYGEKPGGGGSGPAGPSRPQMANTGASGGFPGVILWPEVKPVVTLIAPIPALGSNPFQGQPAQPLSIPFAGQYWMFRWPFAHPPSSSIREEGTPARLGFSTTDHTPLQMEADQKLETAIDLRCCRAIDLEILNADRYPGAMRLELILIDSEHTFPMQQSLGIAVVKSHPGGSDDAVSPVGETLSFAVPAQSALEQFNELKVVFHRAGPRMDKSARVSVERFILQPR